MRWGDRMRIETLVPNYITLMRDLPTLDRCTELIALSQQHVFEGAPLSHRSSCVDVHNNDRIHPDDPALAAS